MQLNTNLDTMPIGNASIYWGEEASLLRMIGRIIVEPRLPLGIELAH